jgi:hypothetical protein
MAVAYSTRLFLVTFDFEYRGQGFSEGCKMRPFSPSAPVESAEPAVLQLADYRAALLPEDVRMIRATVKSAGKPPDSSQVLTTSLVGLTGGGPPAAYKYAFPDNPYLCISYSLNSVDGRKGRTWVRILPDGLVSNWALTEGLPGVRQKPAAMPAAPSFSNTTNTLWTKYLEAFLYLTCWGIKNTGSDPNFPIVPATPYLIDDWKKASFSKIAKRNVGKVVTQERGRR